MANEQAPPTAAIDTANMMLVARNGRGILVMRPPMGEVLTDAEALSFAAWLVAMVDHGPERFAVVLKEILNT